MNLVSENFFENPNIPAAKFEVKADVNIAVSK